MIKLKIFNENIATINSYLLIKRKALVVIDPGFNGEAILGYCRENEIRITDVVLTHGHYDHIKGIENLAKEHSFRVIIGETDLKLLSDDEMNYAKSFGKKFRLPDSLETKTVKDGEEVILLDEPFRIIATPGHTKGSISIAHENWLFTGDTLFYDSVGRTDLATGSQKDLKNSIEHLKKTVSNQTIIYPGHGEHGDMRSVKEINRFLK